MYSSRSDARPARGRWLLFALVLSACGGASGVNNLIAPTVLDFGPTAFSFEACDMIDTPAPTVDQPITSWLSVPSLPTGLGFDTDGSIVGIPTAVTPNQNYVVTASNIAGSVQDTISIQITPAPTPGGLTYASPTVNYPTGIPIQPNVPSVTGNITSWTISPSLPPGLTLSALTGVLLGTPISASPATTYTVTAADCAGGQTTGTLSIAVQQGTGGSLDTPRFAFAANSGDGTISINTFNPTTGKLGAFGYAFVGGTPVAVERSAGHDELFVLDQSNARVLVFSINPVTGRLTAIPGSPFALPTGAAPTDFRLDAARARLFVVNTGTNSISVFSVAGDGTLSPAAGSPFAVPGSEPVDLALDPDEDFLFVACRGSDQVATFPLAPSGVLSPAATTLTADSPLCVDTLTSSNGTQALYVGSGGLGRQVQTFTISATGTLTPGLAVTEVQGEIADLEAVQFTNGTRVIYALNSSLGRVQRLAVFVSGQASVPVDSAPFYTGASPVSIAVSPDEGHVVVVFMDEAALSSAVVDIGATGTLTPVAPSSSPTDRQRVRAMPSDVVLVNGSAAPSFVTDTVYATNFLDDDLAQFTFTGAPPTLTSKVPATVAAGAGPNSVIVHPTLDKAYVINTSDTIGQDILVYDIGPTGSLVTPPVSVDLAAAGAAGSGGWSGAIDPSGRFLIVSRVAQVSQAISYPIDANGNLGNGLAAAGGDTARGGAIDPTGRFFYMANSLGNTVSMFSINPSTGALTSIGAPVATGTAPWAVTVDPTGRFAYVANSTGNSISAYAIDPLTGTLSLIQAAGGGATTAAGGAGCVDLGFERGGRLLYVVCESTSEVNRFLVNLNSSDSNVDGTPFLFQEQSVGGTPRSLAFDGANTTAFVALSNSGEVETYSLDVGAGGILMLSDTDMSASATATRALGLRTRIQ